MHKMTVEIAAKNLNERIAVGVAQANLVEAMLPALQKFDGKAVNKRIFTALEAALPDATIYMEDHRKQYGSCSILAWGRGVHYNHAVRIRLPDEKFDYAAFVFEGKGENEYPSHAVQYMRNKERAAKMQEDLKNLPALVEAYNNAQEAMQKAESALRDGLTGLR